MAQCGFGRVVTNGVWDTQYSFGTDLDGRFLYLRDNERQWLLAVFDFSYQFRRTSLAWRQAVSTATGIPVKNIWVHELQNHSAPCAPDLDGEPCERLIARCLPVIKETMGRAKEAELAYVLADLGDRFNMNREQYIPGLGAVTVWTGCEFDAHDRPYTQDPSIMLLQGWKPDLPAFSKRIYFDRPADPQGALLIFRNKKTGKTIGTLSRFAAHADIVSACWDLDGADLKRYRYHFDWPGYLRQTMEERVGGMGICVCGPCGNLSTKKRVLRGYQAGDRQAKEIGIGVAEACLAAWKEEKPAWQSLSLGKMAHTQVNLPLRDGFPRNRDDVRAAEGRAKDYAERYNSAIKAHAPAFQIKQLIDEYYHWTWVPSIVDRWVGLSEEELRVRRMTVEVEALRLNELVLAGLPGESMTETSQWLRAQSKGQRLIVLDQVNGYCAYQTTREQYDLGAYSYACSCLARDATSMTRQQALEMIRQVG